MHWRISIDLMEKMNNRVRILFGGAHPVFVLMLL